MGIGHSGTECELRDTAKEPSVESGEGKETLSDGYEEITPTNR